MIHSRKFYLLEVFIFAYKEWLHLEKFILEKFDGYVTHIATPYFSAPHIEILIYFYNLITKVYGENLKKDKIFVYDLFIILNNYIIHKQNILENNF